MKKALLIILILFTALPAWPAEGIIKKKCKKSLPEVTEIVLHEINEHDTLKLRERYDPMAGGSVDEVDAPVFRVVQFDYPEFTMAILESDPVFALDMPMKFVIWQDKDGNIWISANDPEYLTRRYALDIYRDEMMNIKRKIETIIDKASK
ncbi:MAG: DUF302 domain-containing protein [Candidatus Kapaibacterium sp.]